MVADHTNNGEADLAIGRAVGVDVYQVCASFGAVNRPLAQVT